MKITKKINRRKTNLRKKGGNKKKTLKRVNKKKIRGGEDNDIHHFKSFSDFNDRDFILKLNNDNKKRIDDFNEKYKEYQIKDFKYYNNDNSIYSIDNFFETNGDKVSNNIDVNTYEPNMINYNNNVDEYNKQLEENIKKLDLDKNYENGRSETYAKYKLFPLKNIDNAILMTEKERKKQNIIDEAGDFMSDNNFKQRRLQ